MMRLFGNCAWAGTCRLHRACYDPYNNGPMEVAAACQSVSEHRRQKASNSQSRGEVEKAFNSQSEQSLAPRGRRARSERISTDRALLI